MLLESLCFYLPDTSDKLSKISLTNYMCNKIIVVGSMNMDMAPNK